MTMLTPFRQTTPDRLDVRDGGGCMAVFGLPFFLAGVYLLLVSARIIPVQDADEISLWKWLVILFMALTFFAAGGTLVLGRRWVRIDKGMGRVVRQWGWLVPMKQIDQSLYDYNAVVIKLTSGQGDSSEHYRVSLKPRASGDAIFLYSSKNYEQTWDRAALVSEFLGVPLEDVTTPFKVVVDADRVYEPLGEQIRRSNPDFKAMAPPPSPRSQISVVGKTLQMTIPGRRFHPGMLIQFVFPIVGVTLFVLYVQPFFVFTDTPPLVQRVATIFVLGAFGLFPILKGIFTIVAAIWQRTQLTVTQDEMVIVKRRAWGTKTTTIPGDQILKLTYGANLAETNFQHIPEQRALQAGAPPPPPMGPGIRPPRWLSMLMNLTGSKGLTVKSRRELVTFGAGLSNAEMVYMCWLINQILAGLTPKSSPTQH